jgi:hypothetical protein
VGTNWNQYMQKSVQAICVRAKRQVTKQKDLFSTYESSGYEIPNSNEQAGGM